MNVYFVSAGEVTEYDHQVPAVDPPETYFLVGLVAAPRRSAAIYRFWCEHQRLLGDLTDQRWQTKCIEKGTEHTLGTILEDDDPLWRSAALPEPRSLGSCD
ncbi:hypothetical protein LCGC14_1815400 [marine sediment metagenome]|uniref:Uncharacterized protein n=1 Tax=marine sediment metagenome TaxID=412755 RepID=A0A0F9GKM4_9ZZZZ